MTNEFVTISVKPNTKTIIAEMKRGGESYDDVVQRLIANWLTNKPKLEDWMVASIKRQEEICNAK